MIKNFIKKICFILLGNLTLLILDFLLKKNSVYVVNYHATYPKNKLNFFKQIEFYKKYFEIIDENSLLNFDQLFIKNKKPKILITFDDGHISNYYNAKNLDQLGIKATFFLPISVIQRKTENNIELENQTLNNKYSILSELNEDIKNNYHRLTMTWQQVIDLSNRGHFIGSHGYNHIRLSNDLNESQLNKEVVISKKIIEEKLGKSVNSFCWIIGDSKSYSKNASKIITKVNYNLSFMTCAKPYDKDQSSLQIHRFNIEDFFSLARISFIFSGIYELMYSKKRNFVNQLTK